MTIDRNSDGEPTGIFIDQNTYPTVEFNLMRVVPRFNHAQKVEALKRSMALYNSVGTTGTYEGHGVAPEIVRAYKEVWDSGSRDGVLAPGLEPRMGVDSGGRAGHGAVSIHCL